MMMPVRHWLLSYSPLKDMQFEHVATFSTSLLKGTTVNDGWIFSPLYHTFCSGSSIEKESNNLIWQSICKLLHVGGRNEMFCLTTHSAL